MIYGLTEEVSGSDVFTIVTNMRELEYEYASGRFGGFYGVAAAIQRSIRDSQKTWCFYTESGHIVAIAGVVGQNFWLQTTKDTDRYPKTVIRLARKIIKSLPEGQYYSIFPESNKRVMLLAKACGFTDITPLPDYLGTGIDHVAAWRL